jgi:hypothetical protein
MHKIQIGQLSLKYSSVVQSFVHKLDIYESLRSKLNRKVGLCKTV